MAADASFYDENWTLLNKIESIKKWLEDNYKEVYDQWNWKGNWVSGNTYHKYDVVLFANAYFMLLEDYTGSVHPPINPAFKKLFHVDVDEIYEEWNWVGDWVSNTPYSKYDVVRYNNQFYMVLVDYAGSPDVPPLNPSFQLMFEIAPKTYRHSIEMTKSGTTVSFSYISSESTPFTFATFAAKYPSSSPLKVSAGYVYTSSVYQGPITSIFNMSGLVVNYITAGGNSTSMVVINSNDTFTDIVEEV